MGKSAGVLGSDFGKTAKEMNAVLKDHGYLYGEPGAYGLTEKGQFYGEERHHSRGTGGYAHYNPGWETRTWNDDTAAALRADMEDNADGHSAGASTVPEDDCAFTSEEDRDSNDTDDDGSLVDWRGIAGLAVLASAALLVAPHVVPFWNDKLKPAARKLWNKCTKQEAVDPQEAATDSE